MPPRFYLVLRPELWAKLCIPDCGPESCLYAIISTNLMTFLAYA